MNDFNFSERVALITGGASGLGADFCEQLASRNAVVIVADIDIENGNKVAAQLIAKGLKAEFIELNVSSEESWLTCINYVKDNYRKLDVLVNNAGIAGGDSPVDTSLDDWKRIIDVNLTSVFLGCKYCIDLMAESGGGSIINISSVFGQVADQATTAYSASKGGVRSMTKSIALYCAEQKNNIRVNSVHPGFVMTPMVANLAEEAPEEIVAPYMQRTVGLTPLGRIAEPSDISGVMLFLASELSRFMTGSELTVDGGFTAR